MNAQNFYEYNKDATWIKQPIPNGLTIDQQAQWILLNSAWIELDLTFDITEWQKEAQSCSQYLVPHRDTDLESHNGWRSCCIHGIDVDKTKTWDHYVDKEEYQWTSISPLTPSIKEFCEKFPFEKLARVRFMEVSAGGNIAPHCDFNLTSMPSSFDPLEILLPINIAIIHPAECYMTLKDKGTVPWKEGKVILVNISNYHSVINNSSTPRTHLIIHGITGSRRQEFCELLVRSYERN
jgi:Aspartyl/Asparaginyl beta-hydroxylase